MVYIEITQLMPCVIPQTDHANIIIIVIQLSQIQLAHFLVLEVATLWAFYIDFLIQYLIIKFISFIRPPIDVRLQILLHGVVLKCLPCMPSFGKLYAWTCVCISKDYFSSFNVIYIVGSFSFKELIDDSIEIIIILTITRAIC